MKKNFVTYLLIIFALKISLAQEGCVYFRDINTEVGLPSNGIFCITQDKQGFMWFATGDGLVRYDGYTCKIYQHDPNDPKSISWNGLRSVYEDRNGNLWIGTTLRGLNRFDREKEIFIRYEYNKNDNTSLSYNNHVKAIYEDNQGRLWIGTGYGLNLYDAERDCFIRYTNNPSDPNSINPDNIGSIYEDSRNNFWVCTYDGLELFDRETGKVVHFRHNPNDPTSICGNFVKYMFEDRKGVFWVGTTAGFNHLFYEEDRIIFKHVKYKSGLSSNCRTKKAYDLYKRKGSQKLTNAYHLTDFVDRQGNVWIGTRFEGIKLYTARNGFHTYKYDPDDPEGLRFWSVSAICESSDGNLWIGLFRGGVHYFNRTKNCFTHIPLYSQSPDNQFPQAIYALKEDRYGDLWIGTYGLGVYKLDKKSGKLIRYMPEKNNPASINSDVANSIIEDGRQNIWIGTWGGGVNLYNRKNNNFSRISIVDKSDTIIDSADSHNDVHQIYEDSKKNLWFVTSNGAYLYNNDNKTFRKWGHDRKDTVAENNIYARIIYEDSKGNLWFGTGHGLYLFNQEDSIFTRYEEKDGLPASSINGILEDDQGNLWLSTYKGLSKFNPKNNTFRNYYNDDGLQGDDFNAHACIKLKTGELVFGGKNGFTIFHPDSIKDGEIIPPPVVITDFQVFNKTVKPGGKDSPLQKSIGLTNEITLPYYQHSISFEFAVLDYLNPKRNQYKYMLEGFNKDWIESPVDHRIATFTNLYPGTYVFRIIGANSKDIWNLEGASIKIIITPPWWRTTLAYIVYIILTGLIVWLIWKTQLRRVHIRQELRIKQFETDKLQELDKMKSRFFANISHEIRTPLTLILGPLEQLISEASKDKWKNQLQIMSRNGRQLLRMINQLLDFSKAESGRILLKAKEVNIVPLLKGMVYSFDSLAKLKKITLTFNSENDVIPVYIDTDKLEKIMANLLSNAFKFTEPGGTISVKIMCRDEAFTDTSSEVSNTSVQNASSLQQYVQISVSDSGIGIAPEHLDHIFDRYYQTEDNKDQTGTGIGLALTKELVELHHGHIFVQSEAGKGSTFIVQFLSGRAHFNSDEIVEDETSEISEAETITEEFESVSKNGDNSSIKIIYEEKPKAKKDQPIILIVEDTEDVRNYIRGFLESKYQIKEAHDGNDGYEKAIEIIPDLIVSDVMMPGMDGFQLCEKLKTDERTSHIPVILLTARASEGSKLEGLETGADDYIIKPFNSKELEIRIKNLIEQRQKLRERFTRDISLAPKDISVTSADEQFLNRAIELVEKHMADPEFGVDIFGKEIGLSHSQLHRKIRALTNLSPVEFIRTLRLKRAVNLLEQNFGNVAEIAYEVGFNNPSYFTECFRKLFGKSPSDYLTKN